MKEFVITYQLNFVFRILVACFCGVMIGYERTSRAKEAGIRTHCIVACASAMMMIISKYGFFDLIDGMLSGVDVRLDPSRMAQGIVTGVGFLGSGMIYHQRGSVQGLTTAAGVWATSGIGMALGAGMYLIGISTTAIILLVQFVFHSKKVTTHQSKPKILTINSVTEFGFEARVLEDLKLIGIAVNGLSVRKNIDNTFDYTFYVDVPEGTNEEMVMRKFESPCSIDFIE